MPINEQQQINDIMTKGLVENISKKSVSQSTTKRPTVYIMVGLPRSGKSTYAKRHKGLCAIVSADQLRYLVYGQRFWGPGEDLMWAIRKIILKMLMEQGIDIVIDETNTTVSRRKPIVDLAREYGYFVEAVIINTAERVCIERAKSEGDDNLIPIIERMAGQFEPVQREEVDYIYMPLIEEGGG
jgi:predicted kinase